MAEPLWRRSEPHRYGRPRRFFLWSDERRLVQQRGASRKAPSVPWAWLFVAAVYGVMFWVYTR